MFSRSQTLAFFSNTVVKWILAIFLCSTVIMFITTQFLYAVPVSHHRPYTNITFTNKDLCSNVLGATKNNGKRTAVIVVLTSPDHFEHRQLIRQTYGGIKSANNVLILAVVFMLGNPNVQGMKEADRNDLRWEIGRFGDIIAGDFIDSYRNLTRKTIMAYEWLTSHCRQAQFVVKTDDDVVVNVFQLTKELNAWSDADVVSSKIWCNVHKNESTIKRVSSRFYASPIDFPSGTFTDHCAGIGYVTTIQVIDRLVQAIRKSFPERVCTHEDVFMTSIVRNFINSNPDSMGENAKPIELVDRPGQWKSYALENGKSDEDHFFRSMVKQRIEDIPSEILNRYRRKYDKRIFYLVGHTVDFKENYLHLWQIIKQSYSN